MYNSKKICFRYAILFLFFIYIPLSVFAHDLQTVRTKYFDIIYAEQSRATAALLAEHADRYADEICTRLGKTMPSPIPVYLVPDTQALNGYFISIPYNRIVLYDTVDNDGLLGNFTNSILNVFYHELTHAISLNSSIPFIHFLQPMSFTEGVAVCFESLGGEGRVHDPLAKHYLIQNKIDGTTPLWEEAAGTRDVYPGGLWPYIYGGYFADYLQKKYGMDTYSQLWQNSWRLIPADKFQSIFKKDVQTAWNQFINTIPIPEKLEEPLAFTDTMEKSGYTALAPAPNGFAYYDFDKKAVYFVSAAGEKPVKLFTADNSLSRLSFSEDGKELLVSDSIRTTMSTGLPHIGTSIKRSRIFNMKTRKFTDSPFFSTTAACFIDPATLCAITVKNQFFSIDIIDRTNQHIKKTLYTAGPGNTFTALYSPCYIGNGTVACIAANGIKRTLLFIDTNTAAVTALPENTVPSAMRYLQAVKSNDQYVLSFAWAEMDMLYRLGLYYPASGTMKLQDADISGGVFFPAVIPHRDAIKTAQKENHSVVYVGNHGTYHTLYNMNESKLVAKMVEPAAEYALKDAVSCKPDSNVLRNLKPFAYQPAAWLWKAKIAPAVTMPDDFKKIGHYGLGVNLFILDPTETIEIKPSAMVFGKPFFIQGRIAASYHFRPLSLHFSVADSIDAPFFKYRRTGFGTGISRIFPLNYSWENLSLGYYGDAYWLSELSDKTHTHYTAPYRFTVLSHQGTVEYKNAYKTAIAKTPFFTQKRTGIAFQAAATHAYCIETKEHAAIIQSKTTWHVPLLPMRCTIGNYVGFNTSYDPMLGLYTHPFSGFSINTVRHLPAFDVYKPAPREKSRNPFKGLHIYTGISAVCDVTLFSYEIQRSGSILPIIFFNRFNVHAGYTGIVTKRLQPVSNYQYLDTAYLNATIDMNGGITSGIEYIHPLRTPEKFGKVGAILDVSL